FNGTVNSVIEFDGANRPTRRTDTIDGETFVTEYDYEDGRDNLTRVTYPSGREVVYGYDAADRISGVPGWASGFEYHPSGAVRHYNSNNNTSTQVWFEDRHRPQSILSGPLAVDYNYDNVGNVTEITNP